MSDAEGHSTLLMAFLLCFFFQAEDGIRDHCVTGVQTCALPIWHRRDRDPLGLVDGLRRPRAAAADREQGRAPPPRRVRADAVGEDLAEVGGFVSTPCRRSEERRGGKEWRSRWAPYP